jgi:hypothetical protein
VLFQQDIFKNLGDFSGEDIELNKLAESYIEKGAKVPGFEREKEADRKAQAETEQAKKKRADTETLKAAKKRKNDEFEVVHETAASSELFIDLILNYLVSFHHIS